MKRMLFMVVICYIFNSGHVVQAGVEPSPFREPLNQIQQSVTSVSEAVGGVSIQLNDTNSELRSLKAGVDAVDSKMSDIKGDMIQFGTSEGEVTIPAGTYDPVEVETFQYPEVRHVSLSVDFSDFAFNGAFTGVAWWTIEATMGDSDVFVTVLGVNQQLTGGDFQTGYKTIDFNTRNWRITGANGASIPFSIRYTETETWRAN